MSESTLRKLISSYLALSLQKHVFIWQGGEPTLMGKHFYARAIALQNKIKKPKSCIENCLQTNATLMTPEFAQFLGRHHFLVGVSIDGPETLHNTYRTDSQNKGSYARVMQGVELMAKHGVSMNALTLLTSHNAAHALDIFYHLAQHNMTFQQFIPCVEMQPDGTPYPWTITPAQWAKALCVLFDAWLASQGKIVVRYFEALLYTMTYGTPGLCHMDTVCGQYAVVEYNGNVYPCDFFVQEQWKLGNIHENAWEAMLQHPARVTFCQAKSAYAPVCTLCPWLRFCAGDCQKHRREAGRQAHTPSWLCEGYKTFFAHAIPILQKICGGMA